MTVADFIAEWRGGGPQIVAHTSGSTGVPKEIRLPRSVVEASAWRSIRHFGLSADSRLHLCLLPDYIAGKMVIVRALLSGARFTWEHPTQEPLKDLGPENEITLLSVIGAQVMSLVERRGSLPKIKHLLVGGAPLNAATAEAALQIADHVWESYGMTETASHVALREICSAEEVSTKPFKLLPGVGLTCDEEGRGVIEIENLDTLVTNDIIELCGPDEFFVKGRADNVIITGGKKVNPEQVERKISGAIARRWNYFVAGVPDAKWGNLLALVIESKPLSSEESEALLRACAAVTSTHERPRRVICRLPFARTASGKIIRRL